MGAKSTSRRSAAGRKPKFSEAEAMQAKVDEYFAICESKDKPPTISGLAYHLGMSTEALRKYEGKQPFVATVKRAKQRVEIHLEERLDGAAPAGAIFNLKNNFGWKDKTEVENTGEIRIAQINRRIVDPKQAARPGAKRTPK